MICYLAVTVHWINSDWELEKSLLAFNELQGSHSGENLADELYGVLDDFGIKNKVLHILSQTNISFTHSNIVSS